MHYHSVLKTRQRSKMPRRRTWIGVACLVGMVGLMACAPVARPAPLSPPHWLPSSTLVTRVSQTVLATPTGLPTLEPLPTAQTIDTAVAMLQRALQASDPGGLQSLLGNEILLDGALIDRDAAGQWLAARWGPADTSRSVVGWQYVEHFVLLEVQTTGWVAVAPGQTDTITFHLHRYNAEGRGDPLTGKWRIDAIFYE